MRRIQTEILVLAVALATLPRPANAQSGALIGVTADREAEAGEGTPPPTFRTLWITNDGARARQVIAIPALVLPRRDGFWRLGIATVCERNEDATNQSDRDDANEIQQPLPLAITGHDTLSMPWTSIVAAAPQATDAFSSPAGDILIVVAPDELQVFGTRGRSLGQKLVTVPAGRVIMIQWALGRNVARWTNAMRQLAVKPLPEPIIRAGSQPGAR
jgi:hypothetical protein